MAALCKLCGISVALFAVLAPALAAASELSGRVVGVADGDTLTLLHAQTPVRIRLAEIDPEKAQPFGQRSKQSLSDLCYGKEELHMRFRRCHQVFVTAVLHSDSPPAMRRLYLRDRQEPQGSTPVSASALLTQRRRYSAIRLLKCSASTRRSEPVGFGFPTG